MTFTFDATLFARDMGAKSAPPWVLLMHGVQVRPVTRTKGICQGNEVLLDWCERKEN